MTVDDKYLPSAHERLAIVRTQIDERKRMIDGNIREWELGKERKGAETFEVEVITNNKTLTEQLDILFNLEKDLQAQVDAKD